MRRKTRQKINKVLIALGLIIIIIILAIVIAFLIKLSKTPEISYDDSLVGKNRFVEIKIDLSQKEVKRDDVKTTLVEEFGISEEKEEALLSSEEELRIFLAESVFNVYEENGVFIITNPYQTKCFIVEADDIKEKVEGEEINEIQENLYILSFYSEKLTKAMYNYYKDKEYIENIFYDEIFINQTINDISQTMYGQTEVDLENYHSLGVSLMGLDNYQKIINENGNPNDIVISTIGYGIDYQNEIFSERLTNNYYNFILENEEISETTEQGSRIAEVLADSTTSNVKLMPCVVVDEEGYSSIASIIRAIAYSVENADVACYELINTQNDAIDLSLERAFKEDLPVCVVSSSEENYPANHGMTIAVSSIDRDLNIADYSSQGDFIDFAAPSTDVLEIFNSNSTVSRWSGPGYSNAQIVATIALIKTYDKEATILDIYNFLRNFCVDLGEAGKDDLYGYGMPEFSNLTIADIDKISPLIKSITFDNEIWEVLKQVKITASDNIRVYAWAITKEESEPKEEEWQVLEEVTHELDVTAEVTENGTYYIYVKDSAGNITSQSIQVDKVDNTPPQIAYTIDESTLSQGYVMINVTAEDLESGLYDSPFSWDKTTWSQENNMKKVTQNGRYTVYVKDNLENISELEIKVECFPQEGTYLLGSGNIIDSIFVSAQWQENTNNNVQIILNQDLNIAGYQITTSIYVPDDFVEVSQNIVQEETNEENETNTSLTNNTQGENITQNNNTTTQNNLSQEQTTDGPITITRSCDLNTIYYVWIKDQYGNISCQTFTIQKATI